MGVNPTQSFTWRTWRLGGSPLCCIWAALFALACDAPAPRSVPPPADASDRTPPPDLVPSAVPPQVPSAAHSAAAGPSKPSAFPPPPLVPPVPRTQKPGDGVWSSLAVHGEAGTKSPLVTTLIHPHKIRSDIVVALVAIDLSRVTMELVAGTTDPDGSDVPAERRPGLVPAAALDSLIAVTNGGFMKRHGGYGIGVGADVLLAPRPEGCTFARLTTGGYRIASSSRLAPDPTTLAWFRQTPPCLIEDGTPSAALPHEYQAKRWGGAEDGRKDIRRSAIGLGSDPDVLYFAIGEWVTAEWLTAALVAAGIQHAAELDINYSYTRFIVYQHPPGGELVATSPLLTELKAPRREFWKDPSDRDFFYIRWR